MRPTLCLLVALAACGKPARHALDAGPSRVRIAVAIGDEPAAWAGLLADERFAAAGLEVAFRPIRGANQRMAAFESGAADALVMTLDGFAALAPEWQARGAPLAVFLLAGWDHGSIGVVARARSVDGLRDGRAATVRRSPGHFFAHALWAAAGLDGNFLFVTRAAAAVDAFRHDEAQAAALAEPHLREAAAGGKGHVLVSTATASALEPVVLFARASFLAQHPVELTAFARAWDEGVRALERDPAAAAQRIARALEEPAAEIKARIARVRYATLDDSRAFFGLGATRSPFAWLLDEAGRAWRADGLGGATLDANTARWTHAVESAPPTEPSSRKKYNNSRAADPFLKRTLTLPFDEGSEALEPPARAILDGVAPWLVAFGEAGIRIECNTEDLPPYREKYIISKKRAQAIADYLQGEWGIAAERMRAIGNGPEHPIASNATDEGRERNRRTEIFLFANE
jgi:outer membrane protein OmpA-like peptidoglycan-associated protein/ABC-type nitrate/sulfonate/bicarbonate transport system substrate-binding protein